VRSSSLYNLNTKNTGNNQFVTEIVSFMIHCDRLIEMRAMYRISTSD